MKTVWWILIIAAAGWAVYAYVLSPAGGIQVVLAEQNGSGESGTAVLEEQGDVLRITLDVQGQPAGVSQPTHIHAGTCAELGIIVYPLTFPADGGSVTELEVSLDALRTGGPYAVNVHKSGQEPQIYVACGDIVL
jgi:hypothetical protein